MLAKLPSPRSIAAKMIRLGVVIRIISYRDTDAYVAIHCAIDSLQDSRLSIVDGPIPPYRRYNAENVRAMGREKFRIPVRASIISRFQIYERENSSHRHLFIVTGGESLVEFTEFGHLFSSRVPPSSLFFCTRECIF